VLVSHRKTRALQSRDQNGDTKPNQMRRGKKCQCLMLMNLLQRTLLSVGATPLTALEDIQLLADLPVYWQAEKTLTVNS